LKPIGKKYSVEKVVSWKMAQKGLEELFELHQDRWNSLGYPGLFFDKRYYDFIKELCQKAVDNEWLWFRIGKDQEGTCAVRLALNYKGRFYDWLTGFDMTSPVSDYSPGLGLLSLMIKDAIESGADRIELLRGDERYKFDFTKKTRSNWRLTIPSNKEETVVQKLLNKGLKKVAKIYAQLNLERTLLKVQYEQVGPFRMIFSYANFRTQRLIEKLKITKIFK
jgi:hypothetical protein